MAKKIKIKDFVNFLEIQAGLHGGVPAGYIMGSCGETLTQRLLETFARGQRDYSTADYIKYGAAWLGRRVFDCNGLGEGFIKEKLGIDINKIKEENRARFNFSVWCAGANGADMSKMPKMPGVALFMHTGKSITHVGWLLRELPNGDWEVVEARGVKYGVVVTLYSKRKWNRWGLMNKYFDYSVEEVVVPPVVVPSKPLLKKGIKGFEKEVEELQKLLNAHGAKLKVDGDFGIKTDAAVKAYQKKNKLTIDGKCGPKTWASLKRWVL